MKKLEIEVFCEATNNAIVRMPGRAFPGIVIQGDTFTSLMGNLKEALDQLKQSNTAEAESVIGHMLSDLAARRTHYESVLKEHNMRLPY